MTNPAQSSEKLQDAVEYGQDAVKKALKNSNEQYSKALGVTKEQTEKTTAQVLKGIDDISDLQKKSGEVLSKLVEQINNNAEHTSRDTVKFLQNNAEKNMKALKDVMGAKNVQDAVEVQFNYASEIYRDLVEEVTKATNSTVKLWQNIGDPVQGYFQEVSARAAKNINIK